jgi:hypothetical protein
VSNKKIAFIALMVLIGAGLASFAFFTYMYNRDAGIVKEKKQTVTYRSLPAIITVDQPQPEGEIEDPVTVTGKARGYWYNEGIFTVLIIDASGYTVGEGQAQADEKWTTTNFVNFTASVPIYSTPRAKTGVMRLKRTDQSGKSLDYIEVPITFKKYKEENI